MAYKKEINIHRTMILLLLMISLTTLFLTLSVYFNIDLERMPYMIIETSTSIPTNATTVYIPQEYLTIWNHRYESERTEFLYCLYGQVREDGYIITDITTTDIISHSEESISYISCDRTRNYLGNIHSHPQPESRFYRATCELSNQDLFTFGKENQLLTGVMCGVNQFAFYGIDNLDKSFIIKIMEGII